MPVLGQNNSESDFTIKDGCCDTIENMRYVNGSWVNACELSTKLKSVVDNGFRVVHSMDALGSDEVICIKENTSTLSAVNTASTLSGRLTITSTLSTVNISAPADKIRVNSFGNVLFISTDEQESSYILVDKKFQKVNLDELEPPEFSIDITTEEVLPAEGNWPAYKAKENMNWVSKGTGINSNFLPILNTNILKSAYDEPTDTYAESGTAESAYAIPLGAVHEKDDLIGVFNIFVAYELFDGSIIKPSSPRTVNTFLKWDRYIYRSRDMRAVSEQSPDKFYRYFSQFHSAKISLNITIPDNISTSVIKNAVVFSTRDMNIINYDNAAKDFASRINNAEYYADAYDLGVVDQVRRIRFDALLNKDALDNNQPYYQIAEINCSKQGISRLDLTYSAHYKNIESKPVFKPNLEIHPRLTTSGMFEYNNRLHFWGSEFKLFEGYRGYAGAEYSPIQRAKPGNTLTYYPNSDYSILCETYLNLGQRTVKVSSYQPFGMWNDNPDRPALLLYNRQTYPDSRAYKIVLRVVKATIINSITQRIKVYHVREISLSPNHANNTASGYFNTSLFDDVAYAEPPLTELGSETITSKAIDYYDTNILRVSVFGNPFVSNLENTYSIGQESSSIIHVNTSADQLTEGRYGAHPLFVFTSEGIYALEQSASGEALYPSMLHISSHEIIKNTNAAAVNGLVFFLTSRGLHVIRGREVVYISEGIEHRPGFESETPAMSQYCADRRTHIVHNPQHNELFIFNDCLKTYVFNTDQKVFYTRNDMHIANYIGSHRHIYLRGKGLHKLGEETTKPLPCKIKSRALRLSTTAAKRLETVVLRGDLGQNNLVRISLMGSNDLKNWTPIHRITNDTTLRRFQVSYVYYAFEISNSVATTPTTIDRFDIELYEKFFKRLR